MANSTVTINCLQTLQIALDFTAQVALNQHFITGDRLNDLVDLLRRKVFGAQIGINVCLLKDLLRGARPDAVNVGE
jgi:hypothetical protein